MSGRSPRSRPVSAAPRRAPGPAMRRVFRVLEIRPSVVEPARPYPTPPTRGHVRWWSSGS